MVPHATNDVATALFPAPNHLEKEPSAEHNTSRLSRAVNLAENVLKRRLTVYTRRRGGEWRAVLAAAVRSALPGAWLPPLHK